MAANESPADEARRRKRERMKLLAIPVLGIVLGAILLWPQPPQSEPPQSRPSPSAARTVSTTTTMPAAATPTLAAANPSAGRSSEGATSGVAVEARWPTLDLEQLSAANPFAKKPAAEAAAAIPNAETTETSTTIEPAGKLTPQEPLTLPTTSSPAGAALAWLSNVARTEVAPADPEAAPAAPIDYSNIGEVKAIIHGEGGNLALLGDQRLVRAGDQLPGGFRVVAISNNQLLVTPDREPGGPVGSRESGDGRWGDGEMGR